MSISITKRNFLGLHTLFAAISGGGGYAVVHQYFPENEFEAYPIIPLYFYLYGVFGIYIFDICRKHAPGKLLLLYLAMKVLKLLLSIIFIVVYCAITRANEKEFILTFALFYLLYLIYETWFFFSYEWNQIKRKKNKEEL